MALQNFVLAMILHPEAMHKAQEELDKVIGRGRPPTFDDMEDLPYTCAVIKETLRWRTITPLGLYASVFQLRWRC